LRDEVSTAEAMVCMALAVWRVFVARFGISWRVID
jgi:hypothetical protein